MDVSFDQLMQFGVPLVILFFVGLGLWRAARWIGVTTVEPMTSAGIDYLNKQTEATQKSVDSLEQIALLEADIRRSILEMEKAHTNSNSCFSTVHTNESLKTLAKAVERVAVAVNCDVADLVAEMERTLAKQEI